MKTLIALFFLVSTQAFGEQFIDVNLAAHHWNRDRVSSRHLSEVNPGIGFENDDEHWRQLVGIYRNSFRRLSGYALVGYTPVNTGKFAIGIVGGVVTGYFRYPAPAVGMVVSADFGKVGVNILAVPSLSSGRHRMNGFAGLQLRFKMED